MSKTVASAIRGLQARKILNVDIFAAFNILLFILMCTFVYYDRFIAYRGRENILEFFIYAVLIMAAILITWYALRSYRFSTRLLLLIEAGILMHFSGGLIHPGGVRLYDHIFFGIRYDKYVHFTNSFFGALVVKDFFDRRQMKLYNFKVFIVILVVLGFGAVIEIAEYVVTKTVPHNGVGDYDNNMQDLISNLMGGLFFVFLERFRTVVGNRKP